MSESISPGPALRLASPELVPFVPLPSTPPGRALPRIRRSSKARRSSHSALLVPLFYAALLYLGGIVLSRYLYLRPGLLLAAFLPIAAMALLAIFKAPRVVWLPLMALWILLGAWSGETEPSPAPDPLLTQLSDGLLRTVEGTVIDAGPLVQPQPEQAAITDHDTDRDTDHDLDIPQETPGEKTQRVDLQLAVAEVVTDAADTLAEFPKAANARLRLTIQVPGNAAFNPIVCGQRLRAVVRIRPPEAFHDPGVWSRAIYLESQQITASASVRAMTVQAATIQATTGQATESGDSEPRLVLLGPRPGQPVISSACLLNRWRDQASERLQSLPTLTRSLPASLRASPEDAAMLTSLLTGDRGYLTRGLRAGFERTGSFHLVVVSGLHLAILAGCVFALGRRLQLPPLAATALTIALALGYALFTGFAIPAQRGFWMITLYLLGRLLYRNRSPLNVLGFAVLCLAAASPRSLFEASLQMTVLAVAAIAGIAAPMLEHTLHARIQATQDLRLIALDPRLPPSIAQFRVTLRLIAHALAGAFGSRVGWRIFPFVVRFLLRLGELIFVTLVVELTLALPMAMYFHRVTVYALPVNLCILPLLGLLVPCAMLLLLVLSLPLSLPLSLGPAIAMVPAAITLGILHLAIAIVRGLGALSLGDLRVPHPTSIQIAIALALFLLALQLARGQAMQRRLALAAVALMPLAPLWPRPVEHPSNALLFEAIDVGQGDSLLLISPEGKTLLTDGGGLGFQSKPLQGKSLQNKATHAASSGTPEGFDVGEEVVSAVLWSRGIRRLDAVALSHAHHDHMGGLPAVLRNFRPRELWVGNNPPVPAYIELLHDAEAAGTRIRSLRAGDSLSLGSVAIRVLAPSAGYLPGPQPANNDSLVLQASYGATGVLLEGDAEAPEERSILSSTNPEELRSTVLKVGHHGSASSTRPEFLARVAPAWAVISCGRHNRFSHPRPEVLAELQQAGTRTFRTDLDGISCLVLNGHAGNQSVSAQPLCNSDPAFLIH